MPTILNVGPYRIFFYAGDCNEPKHVHVERDDNIAKFWIDPVRLHYSNGFNRVEIGKIHKIINEQRSILLEAWHEYFSS